MQNASLALNAAKEKGPNSFIRYTPALRETAVHRVALRAEVRTGLSLGEFVPYYQPKIDLETGKIRGFEVLGRWHQSTNIRQPDYFIPALDDAELSREYYVRLLDKVLADLLSWRSMQVQCGRLAINTSRSEYADFDLAAHTLGRLERAGLPTSLLGIEITEGVILNENDGAAKRALISLQQAGVQIALDDFGTGYASLTHLKSFPIDVIKIDRSFVASLETDAGNRAIVSAVTGLGRDLGLTVVAEGVETPEQAKILKSCACHEIQGYLCGRPIPAGDVAGFIAAWRPDHMQTNGLCLPLASRLRRRKPGAGDKPAGSFLGRATFPPAALLWRFFVPVRTS